MQWHHAKILFSATGRSDYPNQINNVLGFPYIFRGALDTHAKAINEEMKLAAVHAIAELAKEPVPDVVNAAYKLKRTTFGRDYILPKALDPRLLTRVSVAVAKAAIESGVSRKTITDWEGYANHLREMMGYDNKLLRSFTDMAKANPKRVVFAEANHVNMLKAAVEAKSRRHLLSDPVRQRRTFGKNCCRRKPEPGRYRNRQPAPRP